MAEIQYTVTKRPDRGVLYTWASVTESDTFQIAEITGSISDMSVHVSGTFGGATVTINGGNDSSSVVALTQIGGTAATATAADVLSMLDLPIYIQPAAAGGTSQSIDVRVMVRK